MSRECLDDEVGGLADLRCEVFEASIKSGSDLYAAKYNPDGGLVPPRDTS
jgi:hypothetical protein